MSQQRSRLRIVHVADYVMPALGYQEYLLPKWNARHGHDVHIITSDRYAPVPNYLQTWGPLLGARLCGSGRQAVDGLTLHRLPCLWECRARNWMIGLEQNLRELRPDVVFCHGTSSVASFRTTMLAEKMSLPLLMDNHMTFTSQNRTPLGQLYYVGLRFLTRKLLLRTVHRFLGVAQECCEYLERAQGVPRHLVDLLPLGVDTDLFQPNELDRERLRHLHGFSACAKIVLQTGKLTPDKSPQWLAEAMAENMKQDPDVWLVFVGSGSEKDLERIRAPLIQHGVAERLRVLPLVPASQLAGIYSMADICVYPGASSLSCLEAAACARPVIMTDLPTGRWRADHGIGMCYSTGNVSDLQQKLAELLHSPQARKALGERAHAAVLSSFSYDAIARKAEDFMYDAIARSKLLLRKRAVV